jgi:hypothetical protein
MIPANEQMLASRLNGILDLFSVGWSANIMQGGTRSFCLNSEFPISLEGENCGRFDSALDEILILTPNLKATLSDRAMIDLLIPEIQKKKKENSQFTGIESSALIQRVLATPVRSYRVLRNIFGVTLPQSGPPVQVGPFTIYDVKLHTAQITRGLLNPDSLFQFKKPAGLLIECLVEARDGEKALELADVLFYRFEMIIRFFIGRRTTAFEVGVLNYVGPQLRDSIAIAGGQISGGSGWKGALNSIPIAEPFFSDPPVAFAKLLQLVVRTNNKFEEHIARCAEWTGQAMGDPNAASAFVKAAIALEVLFSANEKGAVTSSFMAQIADSCAFLLARSAANAVEIEREVKRLYGIRSAVVHSGADSVSVNDLSSLIRLAREAVITLLSGKEFEGIDSMAKLGEYFKSKKFESLGIQAFESKVSRLAP